MTGKKRGIQATLTGDDLKPAVDPRNKLNDLTGKEWIQFTRSWFISDGKPSEITREIESHPASFPPDMIEDFIKFFTKKGECVLDPFVGTGSTLVACDKTGRKGVGIELNEKYAGVASKRTRQKVIQGDARVEIKRLKEKGKTFKLCITSPPYWNILHKDKDYTQKERKKKGLDLKYSEIPEDFGNIKQYKSYIQELSELFLDIFEILENGGHLVVIVQNIRDKGETIPIAFDLVFRLRSKYSYQGERIWVQSQKQLRPYGYPFAFVGNIHHHYCLIFKKKV
ncbi:MAG: DNA methyltransferase [Candidatus Helarchaeales archaeon]